MFEFLKPRHLRYQSLEEWREREHITSFRHPGNPKLEARLQRQVDQLRKHLWKKHLARLTPEERKQIKLGTHPSQSPKLIDQARIIFEEFRSRLAHLPFLAEVSMVPRHMDRPVFRVKLSQDVGWRVWQEHIPPFYRGFEVLIALPVASKPPLTRENAEKLIPNGMTESQVYEHLGSHATVSLANGKKQLSYLFHFPPPPPKVDPKIPGITIVVANGVVIDRQFGQ